MKRLTALQVKNAPPGVHGDGNGLYLRVKPSGARSYVLRVQYDGRRQDIGLGSDIDLTLSEAREKAAHLRKLARQGKDAIAERDKGKLQIPNFEEAANRTLAELGKGWGDKTGAQFLSSLENHAFPTLGRHRVDRIESEHVTATLAKIWTEKPQIARKVRHRIIQVLSFSKSHGWRSAPVPLAKEITDGLAKQPESKGFRSMPYKELPEFLATELQKQDTPARLALLFTILTGARSGEVRKSEWQQIDREDMEWKRPGSIMKNGKAHTVTLSQAAIAILDRAASLSGDTGLIFPSMRGKVLTDAALGKMLRDSGRSETVHGFRSTFRDWAAEKMPTIPYAVAEMALAHTVGTATEQAYLRSDLRELRRTLLDAWAYYAAPSLSLGGDNVVAINA
ncbi:tyrosine-type recombinase/integrase [Parasphingorhabdus sp.]|uniref:tyrosine-type recombinase/integrase n=1 Tax=Parasphingorhabdus sp. TaxID=2709688 RepID=UPI0030038303